MDFDDTPEEAAFRASARAWLSDNAVPKGSPDDFSAGHFAASPTLGAGTWTIDAVATTRDGQAYQITWQAVVTG